MRKKYALLTICAVISCATAAGATPASAEQAKPETAEELIEEYLSEDRDNYRMSGEMSMGITAETEGVTVEVPIDVSMDMDAAGDSMHAEMGLQLSIAGESAEGTYEVYSEKDGDSVISYVCEDGDWSMSTDDSTLSIASGESMEGIEWTDFAENDDTYEITTDFSVIKDSLGLETYGFMEEVMESFGDSTEDVLDSMEGGKVTYSFDKESFDLVSMKMDELTGNASVDSDGTTVDIGFSISMDFQFSDFGEVDEDDVTVPDEVKEATEAVVNEDSEEEAESSEEDEDIGSEDGSEDGSDEDTDTDGLDEGAAEDDGEATGISDFGSYNGTALTAGPNDWSIFAEDGWEWDMTDEEEGTYSFAAAVNDKYVSSYLYVYNKDSDGATTGQIEDEGFYGYSFMADAEEGENIPFEFNGLKFGASQADIEEALGEADDVSDFSDGYVFLTYDGNADAADGRDFSVSFMLQDDALVEVEVSSF